MEKGKTHVLEDEIQEDSSQGYPTISSSTYNIFSITTAMESDCVCEWCRPGDGSRLRCNILHDRGKPAVCVGLVLQPLLQTFTEVIIPKGEAEVKVEYGGQTCHLPLLVTPGKRPELLGRNWLSDLCLNWKELAQQHQVHQVIGDSASVKDQIPSLFREEPGKLKGFKAHVEVEPNVKSEKLSPYYHRLTELSVQDGCVLWGTHVLIPAQGQGGILQELHVTHPGVSCMKALSRSYMYWPGIYKDIKRLVLDCVTCQEHRNVQSTEIYLWEWPNKPWSSLHAGFAGPFFGHIFLILVDAHEVDGHLYDVKYHDRSYRRRMGCIFSCSNNMKYICSIMCSF